MTNAINLFHTFECGQCFRWNRQPNSSYIGVANGEVVRAAVTGGELVLEGAKDKDFWRNYFDMDSDYAGIASKLGKDKILKKCAEYGYGIRILRQQPWEALVSFIISANNNIPRIKGIIERLCALYGEPLEFKDKCHSGLDPQSPVYYSFPAPEVLSRLAPADLAPIRAGFRDKYIIDAAKKIAGCEVDLHAIARLPAGAARSELMKISGVGKKVADCTLLFGFGRLDVFPQDVWIKRILAEVYNVAPAGIDEFVARKFGAYGGLAQQYLFYYYREHKMAINN